MNVFAFIGKKLTEFKYKYYALNIIQAIPEDQFHKIIAIYKQRGWELADPYQVIDADAAAWQCKLRKGTSTVHCEWDKRAGGSIYGPQRILLGLGSEFGLSATDRPIQ